MFKTAQDYARQLLDCYFGDEYAALRELFNQARADQRMPTTFLADAARCLMRRGA